jgi:hypothetical protein
MKYIYIVILISQLCSAQTEIKVDENFPLSLLTKDFKNLNHGNEIFEKHPILKRTELNSIIGCIYLLTLSEEEIKKVAIARLKGIATQLFKEGKPIILTYGMDSAGFAIKENENLEDDNHIIYLSIADCIVSQSESKAKIVFNEQTMMLLAQKNGL